MSISLGELPRAVRLQFLRRHQIVGLSQSQRCRHSEAVLELKLLRHIQAQLFGSSTFTTGSVAQPVELWCACAAKKWVARRGLQIVLNIQDVLWLARTVSYMCTQASSNLPFVPYLFHLVPCCPARNFSTCQHLKASMPPTKTSLWVQTPGTSWYHMYPKIAG